MKYKLISLAAALFILVFTALLSGANVPSPHTIQHIATATKPDCTVHEGELCTALPLVSIDLAGELPQVTSVERGEHSTHVSLDVFGSLVVYDSATQNNHLADTPTLTTAVNARYRGNSSMLFDKKSFRLSFVQEDGITENKQSFLGMPTHNDWVLNGPFLDKTLMRNYLCMNVAGQIRTDTPRVRYCELVVNGEYRGVYVAMETVAMSEDRVKLTKYNEGDPYSSYMLRIDRGFEPERILNNFSYYAIYMLQRSQAEVSYPPNKLLTPEVSQYIKNDFSAFEKALYSFDFDSKTYGYPALINTESFVDYYLINEFFGNNDAVLYSTNFYKDLRGKIHIGPVWDFNNSCDNYMDININQADATSGFFIAGRTWIEMLMRDPAFVDKVIARYRKLRKTVLSEQYLVSFIDDTEVFLGDAITRNYELWGYSFDVSRVNGNNKLHPDSRNPANYDAAVQQLKSFIIERGRWMDDNIVLLQQFCHYSRNKRYNH